MPRVSVKGSEVIVRLSLRARAALRRRGFRVPVADVRQVAVEPGWWRVLRGTPGRGVWRPGRCTGFRKLPEGGVDFVAVRAGRPALVLDLDLAAGGLLRRIAVSVRDPEAAARIVRAAMPGRSTERGTADGGDGAPGRGVRPPSQP
ncbi:hypothetical protein [Streptomyces sp. cmx-4-9]|uniref:hypothetical protein n=1 Tax=Streptomyces sp. cmx-4-9 TaxID=2790941 RepID=UPI003980F8BC